MSDAGLDTETRPARPPGARRSKTGIDDATARKLVMNPDGSRSPHDLYRLAEALDREGQDTPEGVQIRWLAGVLEVGNPRVWRCVLDGTESVSERPFAPFFINHRDGLRSFDVDDLPAEAEAPLRALARNTENDVVSGRIFHVLWFRFRNDPNDSASAIDAYLRVVAILDGSEEWPDMEHLLGLLVAVKSSPGTAAEIASGDGEADRAVTPISGPTGNRFGCPARPDWAGSCLVGPWRGESL